MRKKPSRHQTDQVRLFLSKNPCIRQEQKPKLIGVTTSGYPKYAQSQKQINEIRVAKYVGKIL